MLQPVNVLLCRTPRGDRSAYNTTASHRQAAGKAFSIGMRQPHLRSEGVYAAAAVHGCSCQESISWVVPQLSKSPQAVGESWWIKVLYRHDA